MKIFLVTLIIIATHLAATLPARAQETASPASQPKVDSSKARRFITKGNPLTAQELENLNQRLSMDNKICNDAGGMSKDNEIIAVVAGVLLIGTLIYAMVVGAQDTSKFFN